MTTPVVDDTACMVSWYDPRLGFPGDPIALNFPCDEEAFAVITFACMHEHIDRPRACSGCALDVQKLAGDLTCQRCEDGPEPHRCPCLVVIDWDSGEKTIVQNPGTAQLGEDENHG